MVVDLIEELECSYGQVPIDIEFAFTSSVEETVDVALRSSGYYKLDLSF